MENVEHEEIPGLEIEYEAVHFRTNYGRRSSLGVPEEPDEKSYRYEIFKATLFGISLDVSMIGIGDPYYEEEMMMEDVYQKVLKAIGNKLGPK